MLCVYAYSVSAKMALTVAHTVTNIAGTPEGRNKLLLTCLLSLITCDYKCTILGGIWAAQHPHCMRCASRIDLHSVYNAGTVKPVLLMYVSLKNKQPNKQTSHYPPLLLTSVIQNADSQNEILSLAAQHYGKLLITRQSQEQSGAVNEAVLTPSNQSKPPQILSV